MNLTLIYILDLIGTFAFAISGAMQAAKKKCDLFGIFITAFITALGGGTIRDFLLGNNPVGWLLDLNYILVVIIAVVFSFFASRILLKLNRTLFLFDAIGIGVFTIIGIQIALSFNINVFLAVTMGMVSAVFGGILRDIFLNQIPLILRKEIYATACLVGGILFIVLDYYCEIDELNMIITIIFIILIRILAVRFKISLPRISINSDQSQES